MAGTGEGMKKNWTLWNALLSLCLGGFAPIVAAEARFRTWSDSSGKFQIKAKLVSVAGDTITLLKEDGTEIELPLSKLSEADQAAAIQGTKGGGKEEGKSARRIREQCRRERFVRKRCRRRAESRKGERSHFDGSASPAARARPRCLASRDSRSSEERGVFQDSPDGNDSTASVL